MPLTRELGRHLAVNSSSLGPPLGDGLVSGGHLRRSVWLRALISAQKQRFTVAVPMCDVCWATCDCGCETEGWCWDSCSPVPAASLWSSACWDSAAGHGASRTFALFRVEPGTYRVFLCACVTERSTCKSPPSAQCMRGTLPFQVWATLIRPKRAGPGSASLSHPHSWPAFLTDLSIISLCANRHNNHTYLFIEVLLFVFHTRTFQSHIISLSPSTTSQPFWCIISCAPQQDLVLKSLACAFIVSVWGWVYKPQQVISEGDMLI